MRYQFEIMVFIMCVVKFDHQFRGVKENTGNFNARSLMDILLG